MYSISILFSMQEHSLKDSQKYLLVSPKFGKLYIGIIKLNTKEKYKRGFLILSSCKDLTSENYLFLTYR